MNAYYPHIFEPLTIGNVTFKNRIFTAPTMGHMLQNNAPTYPEMPMIANYLEKAKGGAAQVECGGQQVNDPGANPIHSKFDIENPTGWRNFIHFTNAIHFYDAKASYELIHFGSEGEYTKEALAFFDSAPRGPLEAVEDINELRFIEHGKRLQMIPVQAKSLSVDTPKDLEYVRAVLREKLRKGEI